ncbi:MAG: putative SOS response-associated peptidase YedK [Firmicutes bacterium ADurb.Bin193]|nr:MAG: putative SOS response-associated peptidase YedK [Firmicutes bacterium ADurb.Bin193]
MCGRYVVDVDEAEIRDIVNETVKNLGNVKTGEIFPTDRAPVLNNRLKPTVMEWGFPNFRGKGVIINARAETVLEKRTFKDSVLSRRCIIPTTGFYEWKKNRHTKDKYLFTLPQSPILYIAGFYNSFDTGGARSDKFVILTTAANESMREIHDRMPVVLTRDSIEAWACDTDFAMEILNKPPPELLRSAV